MTYVWAYLAGALTLINPCVLPLLPIIIAAAFQNSRLGPLALAAGLTLSFTVLGVGVTAFGHLAGIDDQTVSRAGAVVGIFPWAYSSAGSRRAKSHWTPPALRW